MGHCRYYERGATCQAANGIAHQAVPLMQVARGGRLPHKAELPQKLSSGVFCAGLHRSLGLDHTA